MLFLKKKVQDQNDTSKRKKLYKSIVIGSLAVVAFTAIIVSGLLKTNNARSAGTPQFNYLAGDYEMLQGAKTTSSTWVDPVNSVNIGDEVAVAFYYHNGVVDSIAHATKLRVDLNGVPTLNTISMTSNLWSQETTNITNTVVNGSIVGNTGLTINLPSGLYGRAEYVPASTKLYTNVAGKFTYNKDLADGITQTAGLNIGDVQGCWQYSGLVTFRVKIRGVASIALDKKVAAVGSSTWLDSTSAWAGETMSYRVAIENNGTDVAAGIVLKDVKPSYMTYVAGSTVMTDYLHPTGVTKPDTLFTAGGLVLQDVPADLASTTTVDEGIIYITYKLKIDDALPANNGSTTCYQVGYSLNNQATVYVNSVNTATDIATVNVRCRAYTLGFLKQVKTSATTWGKNNAAKLGDIVEYQITVTNNGNSNLTNTIVRDVVPQYSNYIIGSTTIDGVVANDSIITTGGINVGTLTPAQQKIIRLQVRVYGCVPVGNYTITNTGYGLADLVPEINDTATTTVAVVAPTY